MKIIVISLVSLLSACADVHAYIAVEGMHTSHISQHFRSPATNYGYDAAMVSFRVEKGSAFAEIGEGYIFEHRWCRDGLTGAGAMLGPSEITQLTVGYQWRLW